MHEITGYNAMALTLGFSSYFGDLIKIWTWVFFFEG